MRKKRHSSAYDGNENKIDSILSDVNHQIVKETVPHIPGWIHTHHLTAFTFLWAIVVLIGGYLSKYNIYWVWLAIIGVVGHIVTDGLDGAVGRHRKTGLVRWGYYADHFGDFLLNGSIFTSFKLINGRLNEYLIIFLIILSSGFFVHSFLATTTLRKFTLTFLKLFSPLEGQISIVFLYLSILIFGKDSLLVSLPIFAAIGVPILGYTVIRTLIKLWTMDRPRFPED
ncbi:CDP-alcohol phosphatidyltransferase family protein [Patescibacteria group bacterium]